jgi:hypothetical protein
MPQKTSILLVTSWVRIALDILIVTIIDDRYILNLVSCQVTGVIVKSKKIRATLYQNFLFGREFRQPRLIKSLLGALITDLYNGI